MDIPGDIDPATGLPSAFPPPLSPIDPATGLPILMPSNKPPIAIRVFEMKNDIANQQARNDALLTALVRVTVITTNALASISDEQEKDHEKLNNIAAWAARAWRRKIFSVKCFSILN
jgi:hypothetical protein